MDGDKVLPYRSQLVQILQLTLHLKCKQGYTLACNLLHHILRSSALIYPTEYCSVPGGFHQPVSDYLPIKVLILIDLYISEFLVKSIIAYLSLIMQNSLSLSIVDIPNVWEILFYKQSSTSQSESQAFFRNQVQ